jgi:peroxisomal 2,4-dienoyl-CoA reductase
MSVFKEDILKGKTLLITGGAGDIGLEISTIFSAHGANVAITSRNEQRINAAAEGIREKTGGEVLAVSADVRDNDAVENVVAKTVEKFGGVDILINCAAGNFPVPIAALSPKGFRTVIDIDLQGTFQMTKACFPHLMAAGEKHGNANVLNITTTLQYTGMPFQAHVNAAKAGIDAFTRTCANEWGPLGIRANGVAPGPIGDTEGMRRLAPNHETSTEMQKSVPLRRWGTKREIADSCLFLVSDASKFTTGAILIVDGGSWIHSPGVGGMSVD